MHVADELAPVALEYFPATQKVHAAPDSADAGRVWWVTVSTRHTRHAGRREERQQSSHGHSPVTLVAAPPPHTITLARTSHAHARHACSMTLGERVCVCQGVSVCVMATIASISIVRAAGAVAVVAQPPTLRPQHRGEGPIGTR